MNVLFVCIGNQGRSVIAERLFARSVAGRHATRSAGSRPGTATHPEVLDALREVGVDAADHVPHKLSQEDVEWADIVVATCDDSCPVVPGKRYENWQIRDPMGQPAAEVRAIRDEIEERVGRLATELD